MKRIITKVIAGIVLIMVIMGWLSMFPPYMGNTVRVEVEGIDTWVLATIFVTGVIGLCVIGGVTIFYLLDYLLSKKQP
jgi:hypothetical protein